MIVDSSKSKGVFSMIVAVWHEKGGISMVKDTGIRCKKKVGAPRKGLSLQEKLASHGIDTVAMLAELLVNPDTSDRIKADLLKDIVNYQYAKKKSVQIEDVNGQPITFNLKLTS